MPARHAASRRYPPEHFAAAARLLVREHGIPVVFTGTQAEVQLVAGIQQMMQAPSLSLVNQLNLAELAALFQLAPVVISNNTGPAHIAAAVGTPVVDLYALINPQHTPWMVPNRVLYHDVPCRWCYRSICPEGHHACLRKVEPERVVAAALELLGRRDANLSLFPYARAALPLEPDGKAMSQSTRIRQPELAANLWRATGVVQAAVYVLTGIWPWLSMRTFLKVTGPKADLWLVKTVGALVTVVGTVLGLAVLRRQVTPEIALLGAGAFSPG